MDNRQTEIYKGLKTIGDEIAAFYLDGIKIANSDYEIKAYLLAHIAREIEGGLRDVLAIKKEDVEICSTCATPKKKGTHRDIINSIIKALGIEKDQEFSDAWHKVANEFHRYAHRHGVWKEPKDKEAFTNLWNDFSFILEKLVGNYYSLSSILDIYINSQFPNEKKEKEKVLGALNNILLLEARYVYFFNHLKSKSWLKPLLEAGYFLGDKNPIPQEVEDNPGFFTIPYWTIFEYLIKVAKENFDNPDKEITDILLQIIDDISKHRQGENRIVNFRTDHSICQLIGFLPYENINDYHFEFIKIALTTNRDNSFIASGIDKIFMKRFIMENNKTFILNLLNIILSYIETNGIGSEKITSLMNNYWFENILKTNKDDFIKICPHEISQLCIKLIEEISAKHDNIFNNLTTPAIKDHSQTLFPERYETQVIYLLRDCLLLIDKDDIKNILKGFLSSQIPIFNRMALYVINCKYKVLGSLFWEWKKNPLEDSFKYGCKHEIYELLKNNATEFSADQIDNILYWIEGKKYFVSEDAKKDKELSEKIIAYQKKEWLSSIITNDDVRIEDNFNYYNGINDAKLDHPGFDIWHGDATIGYTSPLTNEEINNFSLSELIDYFEQFESQGQSFIGPSIEGLSDMVILAIKQKPEKFYKNNHLIIKASYQMQYTWMRGLREAWQEKAFNIQEVLETSKSILESGSFWESNNSLGRENFPNLFLTEFLRFIELGLENDNKSFPLVYLPQIESLLKTIIQKDKLIPFEFKELSMKALNNSKGKLYSAIFQYLLKYGREHKQEIVKLDSKIEEILDPLISSDKVNDLLFFTLGQFFPYVFALYTNWTKKKIGTIFPEKNITNFNAAISGYFLYNYKFYLNEFKVLHDANIYKRSICYDFSNESSSAITNLVRHIYIALVEDLILIDDELINDTLNSQIEQHLSSLIHFFWSPKIAIPQKAKEKIIPLFVKIVSSELSKKEAEQNVKLISGISKWFNSMDMIDEDVYNLQLQISSKITESDKHFYIEGLNKHINTQQEIVGKLLAALFENNVSYDISRGMIITITKKLYDKGFKEIADRICLLHGEKGIDFLKELYISKQN